MLDFYFYILSYVHAAEQITDFLPNLEYIYFGTKSKPLLDVLEL